MRAWPAFLCFLSIFIIAASPAMATSIVDQDPTITMFENRTEDPMFIQFDRSLNTDTVNGSTLYLSYEASPSTVVAVAYSFESRSAADDTVVLTPVGGLWPFAKRLLLNITDDLEGADGSPFDGVYTYDQIVVFNVPNDLQGLENYDPTDPWDFSDAFVNASVLLGFNPLDPENTDPSQPETIPGMNATEAWKIVSGRPDVVIAVVDTGLESYGAAEIANNLYLNKEELPAPTVDGTACSPDIWDCNNDGRFNIRDYDDDPTFADLGRTVTVKDLIDTFSDGIDDDGNGYIDDICGWDFVRNTNEALGAEWLPEGDHGQGRCQDAAAVGNNGSGNKPGFCPYCSILPIRTSEAIVGDINNVGVGVEYANIMGADVAVFASGALDYSDTTGQYLAEASANGTVLIGVVSDEMGYHHAYPGSYEDVISVKAIYPIPPIDFLGFIPLEKFAYVETTCTMWGEKLHLTGSSIYCSSDAAGNTAGVAGLIISRARDLGITLTSNEIKQMLTMSADDIYQYCITLTGGGCQRGWDAHYGYGRVNAGKAVDMLGDPSRGIAPRIPPEAKILSPAWFDVVDPVVTPNLPVEAYMFARGGNYTWELQVAVGKEPLDREFDTVASGNGSNPTEDEIAQVNVTSLLPADIYENPPDFSFDFTITLRLQVKTQNANKVTIMGEDRRTIAIHRDKDPQMGLMEGFPIDVGASGEGSVVLYDLDGDSDRRLEIVISRSTAEIEAYKYREDSGQYEMMEGFPVDLFAFNELDVRLESILGSIAVGDLFGDGTPYIVAATSAGAVYVVHPHGNAHLDGNGDPQPILTGFPVFADEPDNSATETFGHGRTFAGSPVLADLDKDGLQEIIAACYDGKIYVWKPTDDDIDGYADRQAGFPVLAQSKQGNVPFGKICEREYSEYPPQILGTPAVGIYDPNSSNVDIAEYPAIIIGTSEICDDGLLGGTGRLYAIYHDGYENASGSAFLPDWPVKINGPLSDALPIPPLTIGITSSPAMARYQDQTYIGISTVVWLPQLFVWDGKKMSGKLLPSKFSINVLGNGSFGRLSDGDELYYTLPGTSALGVIDGWITLLRATLLGWQLDNLKDVAFFAELEDSSWMVNPAIADLSGDGLNEIIVGDGGFMVHAFDLTGAEPPAWPKFTYHWSAAAPSVGDVDGDGLLEIFQHTREGRLYGWETIGDACNETAMAADWWSYHHDERNTSMYGTDTIPPFTATDLTVTDNGDGTYELSFTGPGDDWACGKPESYDIRYAATSDELSTTEGFYAAQAIAADDVGDPVFGGETKTITVDLGQTGLWFSVQVKDNVGNLSLISPATDLNGPIDDDDDSTPDDDAAPDDDDTTPDDDDDDQQQGGDDDDDDGCGC